MMTSAISRAVAALQAKTSGLTVRMEKITPEIAEMWLNTNSTNRKLRDGVAEKYADDMANGRWTECPEPISFYADEELADGQHRLYAVCISGESIEFIVVRGLSREAGLNLNTGLSRNLVDNARISGADLGLSNRLLSLARAIETGKCSAAEKPLSNAQRLALVEKHRDAAKWVITNGPKGRHLNNAMVGAALARAWYYEKDEARLKHFAHVFSTGHAEHPDRDSAAVSLRTYFLTKPALGTTALWTETFLKSQNAINYFMAGRRLTVIKNVKEEAYPLPKAARTKKS